MRLQKYMAMAGVASRRACEQLILEGRVTVNGTVAHLGISVEEGDEVRFDEKLILLAERRVVILLYKPRGVVCTSSDPEGRRTVQDCIEGVPERLYNVGRLDLNSEGLLLLTNDGELANRMMHPRFGITKTYYAVCEGTVTATQLAKLTTGVELDDGMTAPAIIRHVRPTQAGGTAMSITIREGRNRQIRRMLEAVGHRTLRLKREAYGPLALGALRPGQWRYLTEKEIEALHAAAKETRQ